MAKPAFAERTELVPFAWNRGWPDGGRALNAGMGAIQMNPAALSLSRRYVAGIDGSTLAPDQDFTLSAGISDTQSSELAGEVNYDFIRHLNGSLPGDTSHRISIAVAERYTEKISFGLLMRMDWPDVVGSAPGLRWGYGLGILVPVLPEFSIGFSSGDWVPDDQNPYHFGYVGLGLGSRPAEWITFVVDGVYRWKEGLGNGLSLSAGTGFLFSDKAAWRIGYRWAPEMDGHVAATSVELQFFPVTLGVDGRYGSESKWSAGLSLQMALFYQ